MTSRVFDVESPLQIRATPTYHGVTRFYSSSCQNFFNKCAGEIMFELALLMAQSSVDFRLHIRHGFLISILQLVHENHTEKY